LKLVSVNVNGVRAALRRGGLAWLAAGDPDVICLQEVRCDDPQLLACLAAGGLAGWQVAHAPSLVRPGHAGVAVLSKVVPSDVRIGLPGFADQGRWIEVDLATAEGPVTIASTYVHTGEAGTDKQTEKYGFLDAVSTRMAGFATGSAVVTGDLNVAHREEDLKNWKGNLGKAGFLPDERAYFDRWLAAGWSDVVRAQHPEGAGPYTWWSWRGKAFDNDTGWRIDYVLASPQLASRVAKAEVGRAASYAERWSDHAPQTVWFD
jgi:exodeoxyribonuclease III